MNIERRCLQCLYAAENTAASQQVQLIGQRQFMCLHGPISTTLLAGQNGGLISIASYPQINDQTVSCGQFMRNPVTATEKGGQDGNA